jgi:hypothetical protein
MTLNEAFLFPVTTTCYRRTIGSMNYRKVAVLFSDGANIYACDYYGDTLASSLLKRARNANS